jgi:hypothetical protein
MGREQERPLSAQLPVSASVVGRYNIVELRIERPRCEDQGHSGADRREI